MIMRKILITCVCVSLLCTSAFSANVEAVRTRGGWATVYALGESVSRLAEGGTLTNGLAVTGAITATGALTGLATNSVVNSLTCNGDLDVNLGSATEEVSIVQTNVAGTASTPLIDIDDARTGATANTAGEAAVHIDTEGTHALAVADGIVVIESSLDTYAAGTLALGDVTANKVEVSVSGVETEIQGTLDVHEDSDFNEQINVDLNAADEEITINQTAVAGPGDAGLIVIDDNRTGATATESDEATIHIDAEGVYAIGILDGALAVESVIDTYAGGALVIGNDLATSVALGANDAAVSAVGSMAADVYIRTIYAAADETNTLTFTSGSVITADTTDGVVRLVMPDASTVLGVTYTIVLVTDGGNDLLIARGGADVFNSSNNTLLTFADVEDAIVMTAISVNRWLIEENIGAVSPSTE